MAPAEYRVRAGEILDIVAKALSAGGAVASNLDDLAVKLAAIRAEVETMAAADREISADELEVAMARVRAASSAFREALAAAESQ